MPCELLDATESDVALRQLTSGSTGTPKAVAISHGNLAANGIAIRTALAIVPGRDVSVSWLPLSHDMGMIAFLCLPMQIGSEAVVVTPDQFLRRPIVWAELISRYKATITSGRRVFYADCDEASVAAAIDHLRPQAGYPWTVPCSLTEHPSVRCTSVVCSEDRVVNPTGRGAKLPTSAPTLSSFQAAIHRSFRDHQPWLTS